MQKTYKLITTLLVLLLPLMAKAQVGSYRTDLAVGINGGYQLNNISFVPKVPQGMLGGINAGITARYVCEKYFNCICAVQLEFNYAQMGWKEDILSIDDEPCVNTITNEVEAYQRTINYFQIPLLAHIGFGREVSGMKFFVNLGPQFGFYLDEKTETNFSSKNVFYTDPERVSSVVAQDTMSVKNKFDYGITAGLGAELSLKRAGHILLEARYYYGLGNIYPDSKADYFARSNHGSIVFKASYLFDIIRTRNAKRK